MNNLSFHSYTTNTSYNHSYLQGHPIYSECSTFGNLAGCKQYGG